MRCPLMCPVAQGLGLKATVSYQIQGLRTLASVLHSQTVLKLKLILKLHQSARENSIIDIADSSCT
jgi:hypothetical protein